MAVKKGYKQTEVGVIPEDWHEVRVNDLEPFITSGSRGWARYYSDRGELFIRITNMSRATIYLDLEDPRFVKLPTTSHEGARTCVQNGDLLVSVTADIGIISWVSSTVPKPAYINQHIALVRPPLSQVDSKFTAYFLASSSPQKRFRAITDQGAKAGINLATVRDIPLAFPPTLAEQEAIAGALSDADAWIESLEQLIAKKRQIKQGAMQELLTGKRRLPGFSGKWEKCSVGDVIEKAFCGPSPTCEERNIHGEEWGVLKTTAMTWEHGWDWTKHKRLPEHYWNQPEIEVHTGDVVVTKAGPRHRVGVAAFVNYVPDRILVSGKMIGLRPNTKRALGFMLAAAISAPSSQKFLDQRTTGMAESQVNFENGVLIGTPICLPSISEQHAIGSTLSDMDAEIDSLESKLAKAREIKQGMMQELLTGKTRLI